MVDLDTLSAEDLRHLAYLADQRELTKRKRDDLVLYDQLRRLLDWIPDDIRDEVQKDLWML